jgi:hypothetical protein
MRFAHCARPGVGGNGSSGSWLCENVLAEGLTLRHWSNASCRCVRSFSESWLAVTTPSSPP